MVRLKYVGTEKRWRWVKQQLIHCTFSRHLVGSTVLNRISAASAVTLSARVNMEEINRLISLTKGHPLSITAVDQSIMLKLIFFHQFITDTCPLNAAFWQRSVFASLHTSIGRLNEHFAMQHAQQIRQREELARAWSSMGRRTSRLASQYLEVIYQCDKQSGACCTTSTSISCLITIQSWQTQLRDGIAAWAAWLFEAGVPAVLHPWPQFLE